jgi:hypothetical protein
VTEFCWPGVMSCLFQSLPPCVGYVCTASVLDTYGCMSVIVLYMQARQVCLTALSYGEICMLEHAKHGGCLLCDRTFCLLPVWRYACHMCAKESVRDPSTASSPLLSAGIWVHCWLYACLNSSKCWYGLSAWSLRKASVEPV